LVRIFSASSSSAVLSLGAFGFPGIAAPGTGYLLPVKGLESWAAPPGIAEPLTAERCDCYNGCCC